MSDYQTLASQCRLARENLTKVGLGPWTDLDVVANILEDMDKPLPPFIEAGVRHREAFLGLIRDITEIISNPKEVMNPGEYEQATSRAISKALAIWI